VSWSFRVVGVEELEQHVGMTRLAGRTGACEAGGVGERCEPLGEVAPGQGVAAVPVDGLGCGVRLSALAAPPTRDGLDRVRVPPS